MLNNILIAQTKPLFRIRFFSLGVLFFCAACVVALALRMYFILLNQPLWYDEVFSSRLYCSNLIRTLGTALFTDRMPVYYILIWAYQQVFGDGVIVLRSFSLVVSGVALLFIYRYARSFLDKKSAIFAVVLVGLHPVYAWYATEVRHYALCLFWFYGTLAVLLGLESRPTCHSKCLGQGILLFIFQSMAMLTHPYLSALPITIIFSALTVNCRQKKIILTASISAMIVFMLYVIWRNGFIPFAHGWSHLRQFKAIEVWQLLFNWFATGNVFLRCSPYAPNKISLLVQNPAILFLQVLIAVIFITTLILGIIRFYRQKMPIALSVSGHLVMIVMICFLYGLSRFWSPRIYIERSLFVLLPIFWVLLVQAVTMINIRWLKIALCSFLVAISILNIIGFLISRDMTTVWMIRPNWYSPAKFIQEKTAGASSGPVAIISPVKVLELAYLNNDIEVRRVERESHVSAWALVHTISSQLGQYHPVTSFLFKKFKISENQGRAMRGTYPIKTFTKLPQSGTLLKFRRVFIVHQNWNAYHSERMIEHMRRIPYFRLDGIAMDAGCEIRSYKRVR